MSLMICKQRYPVTSYFIKAKIFYFIAYIYPAIKFVETLNPIY